MGIKIEKFEKLVGDDYNHVCFCRKCQGVGYFCDMRPSEECKRDNRRDNVYSGCCDNCKMLKICDNCRGRGEYYKYCEPTPEGLM